jgi:predicted thioesterase
MGRSPKVGAILRAAARPAALFAGTETAPTMANLTRPAELRNCVMTLLHFKLESAVQMISTAGLTPGLTGIAELVVGEQHTAPRIGSGRVRVLAIPVMINLIEAAALAAVEHLLPPGHQSLGTHLDVTHLAATPVGMRVRAACVCGIRDRQAAQFSIFRPLMRVNSRMLLVTRM